MERGGRRWPAGALRTGSNGGWGRRGVVEAMARSGCEDEACKGRWRGRRGRRRARGGGGPVAVPVVVLFADSAARAATSCSTAGGAASAGDETSQAATSGAAGILGTRSAWVRARGQVTCERGM